MTESATSNPTAPGREVADDLVHRPTEMIRIQAQLESLAAELRTIGTLPDQQSRLRLLRAERALRDELGEVMGNAVTDEIHHFFDWLSSPDLTSDELRVGLREMVGWVEGALTTLQFVLVQRSGDDHEEP